MNQRNILQAVRDVLADDDLSQALTERLADAAAELSIDLLDNPTDADCLRILDRAIENCPA